MSPVRCEPDDAADQGLQAAEIVLRRAAPGAVAADDGGRYPGRCRTIHLKPWNADPEKGFKSIIGEDSVPWRDIFEFCQTKGNTDWYIIEYECPEIPALEAVKQCLDGALAIRG